MFIVVYPVFHYIVYCVYFEERSKMGLSCPHFIFSPRGRCQAALFLSKIVAELCV